MIPSFVWDIHVPLTEMPCDPKVQILSRIVVLGRRVNLCELHSPGICERVPVRVLLGPVDSPVPRGVTIPGGDGGKLHGLRGAGMGCSGIDGVEETSHPLR